MEVALGRARERGERDLPREEEVSWCCCCFVCSASLDRWWSRFFSSCDWWCLLREDTGEVLRRRADESGGVDSTRREDLCFLGSFAAAAADDEEDGLAEDRCSRWAEEEDEVVLRSLAAATAGKWSAWCCLWALCERLVLRLVGVDWELEEDEEESLEPELLSSELEEDSLWRFGARFRALVLLPSILIWRRSSLHCSSSDRSPADLLPSRWKTLFLLAACALFCTLTVIISGGYEDFCILMDDFELSWKEEGAPVEMSR